MNFDLVLKTAKPLDLIKNGFVFQKNYMDEEFFERCVHTLSNDHAYYSFFWYAIKAYYLTRDVRFVEWALAIEPRALPFYGAASWAVDIDSKYSKVPKTRSDEFRLHKAYETAKHHWIDTCSTTKQAPVICYNVLEDIEWNVVYLPDSAWGKFQRSTCYRPFFIMTILTIICIFY